MNHKEFNRLDAKDILTLLKGHPQADQTAEAAATLLGADVATAWTFRKKAGLVRLVDEQTGKYPTSFIANGQLYHIRSVKEGLGFVRYKEMKQMLSVVGFNATYLLEILKMLSTPTATIKLNEPTQACQIMSTPANAGDPPPDGATFILMPLRLAE